MQKCVCILFLYLGRETYPHKENRFGITAAFILKKKKEKGVRNLKEPYGVFQIPEVNIMVRFKCIHTIY